MLPASLCRTLSPVTNLSLTGDCHLSHTPIGVTVTHSVRPVRREGYEAVSPKKITFTLEENFGRFVNLTDPLYHQPDSKTPTLLNTNKL